MRVYDPNLIRPDLDITHRQIPESDTPPVSLLTTVLFVVAVVALAVLAVVLTTRSPATEVHDSWMNTAFIAPVVEIHDSWMNIP